jgi:hypothetical protein
MAGSKRGPYADDCIGRHVEAAHRDCVRIDWNPVRPDVERLRVRDHTCDCQPVFYELCQAGGQRCIRRTTRKGGRVVVEESGRTVASKTDILWTMLLHGHAR